MKLTKNRMDMNNQIMKNHPPSTVRENEKSSPFPISALANVADYSSLAATSSWKIILYLICGKKNSITKIIY